MIEVLFTVRKDQFKIYPAIQSGLDFVHENDQYTHIFQIDNFWDLEIMIGKVKTFNSIKYLNIFFFI